MPGCAPRAAPAIVGLALLLAPLGAGAFYPRGHDAIEAAAYKRLIAMERVPGTDVSGREVLGWLIAWGVLFPPRCFVNDCDADVRRDTPLAFWPQVYSGSLDLLFSRQFDATGQCQHFLAQPGDQNGERLPEAGVPRGLAMDAPFRCVRQASAVLDGILRDPAVARHQLLGTYTLLHAVEDTYSPAHVERDADGRILYLRSWTLIDWPLSFLHGRFSFPRKTHHEVVDHRDEAYLRPGCEEPPNPYALPEDCLSPLGLAATDAVVDLLVLIYREKSRAAAEHREATLENPEAQADWSVFVGRHLRPVFVEPDLRPVHGGGIARPDVMLGLRSAFGGGPGSVGLAAGATFAFRRTVPFVLRPLLHAAWERAHGRNGARFGAEASLMLPALGTFALGVTPLAVDVPCTPCRADLQAAPVIASFHVIRGLWVEAEGPRWSWSDREFRAPDVRLTLGWFTDIDPPRLRPPPNPANWDPPPIPGDNYRASVGTLALFAGSTLRSDRDADRLSLGFGLRWDRDRWGRRAGLSPGLRIEGAHGDTDGRHGLTLAGGPTLEYHVVPSTVAVFAVPALVRVGAAPTDVGGTLGLELQVNGLELSLESPSLSYVSRDRWRGRPLTLRLALLLDR